MYSFACFVYRNYDWPSVKFALIEENIDERPEFLNLLNESKLEDDHSFSEPKIDTVRIVFVPKLNKQQIRKMRVVDFSNFDYIESKFKEETGDFNNISGFREHIDKANDFWDYIIWKSPEYPDYLLVNFDINNHKVFVAEEIVPERLSYRAYYDILLYWDIQIFTSFPSLNKREMFNFIQNFDRKLDYSSMDLPNVKILESKGFEILKTLMEIGKITKKKRYNIEFNVKKYDYLVFSQKCPFHMGIGELLLDNINRYALFKRENVHMTNLFQKRESKAIVPINITNKDLLVSFGNLKCPKSFIEYSYVPSDYIKYYTLSQSCIYTERLKGAAESNRDSANPNKFIGCMRDIIANTLYCDIHRKFNTDRDISILEEVKPTGTSKTVNQHLTNRIKMLDTEFKEENLKRDFENCMNTCYKQIILKFYSDKHEGEIILTA